MPDDAARAISAVICAKRLAAAHARGALRCVAFDDHLRGYFDHTSFQKTSPSRARSTTKPNLIDKQFWQDGFDEVKRAGST